MNTTVLLQQSLGRQGVTLVNWMKRYTWTPELYFEPRDITEIRQILSAAKLERKCVRVVGSRHTFNEYMNTDDYVISMHNFNKIVKVNQEEKTVQVEAGVSVQEMNEYLFEEGLSLPTQAVEASVTIAGAIATGSHGSSHKEQIMSAYVTEMDIMTSEGHLMTLTSESEMMLNAARVAMGMFGVIVSLTLKCEERHNISRHDFTEDFDKVVSNLDEVVEAGDHTTVMWFPYSGRCAVNHLSIVPANTPTTPPPYTYLIKLIFFLQDFAYLIGYYLPFMHRFFSKLFLANLYGAEKTVVARNYELMTISGLTAHYSVEWAIPLDTADEALREMKRLVEENNLYIHFPVVIRFAKGDDISLSMASGHDVCFINVIHVRPFNMNMEKSYSKLTGWLEPLMMKYGGRPHWGKNFTKSVSKKHLKSVYTQWDHFCDMRKQMDPTGLFLSNQLREWFVHE